MEIMANVLRRVCPVIYDFADAVAGKLYTTTQWRGRDENEKKYKKQTEKKRKF